MDLSTALFDFYKKFGKLMKVILCPLLLVCFILWVIGNFVHLNTLFMFIIGFIVATILLYFYGGYIYGFIDNIISAITDMMSHFTILF